MENVTAGGAPDSDARGTRKTRRYEGATILVVDDSRVNLTLISGILEETGYRVRATPNPEEAIVLATNESPDLIMLDINMPEMDGYEACRILKSNEETQAIPIIFISALDDAMDKVKAFEAGGADYVTKPFQKAEILARIENQLKIARLQREMEAKNVELTRKNEEILRATEQMTASYQATAAVFSTLSNVLPGKVIEDKYRLEELIGRGGHGAVYRGSHLNLNRAVAIKVLCCSPHSMAQDLERFRMEGIFACRVNHPNAVSVWDAGVTSEGLAYLIMELLEGRPLRGELAQRGALSLGRCVEIMTPICGALAAAHEAGVVHRDIKPDNIFLHQGREGEIVKVVDFGIATITLEAASLGPRFHTPGVPVGTPDYIAPERFEMKPSDGRSDIYSLGVMLYEMLCGEVPFRSPHKFPWAVAHMHLTEKPRPLRLLEPSVPADVEALVLRALEKDPSLRPTAMEMCAELIRAAENADRRHEAEVREDARSSERRDTLVGFDIAIEKRSG